jgi:xanthine dehydrogenase accessory factor
MITPALSRRVQELADAGVGFVTATVVRVQHPTSVETGSVAVVHGDGKIEGFVGGVCAEHSVRAYSLLALQSGEPVLLRILPDADADTADADPESPGEEIASDDGAVTVQNPCLSGGAIEVFLEPSLPAPRVVVVGDTPIADAVRRIGAELGLEMVGAAGADTEPTGRDLAIVVAAHGRDELHMLRRGLDAGLPYVGLVASARRGAGVLEELRADGVPDELLARIDVPAGIEIGARGPGEIALSILARVVEVRRTAPGGAEAGESRGQAAAAAGVPTAALAVDPICGMTVAAVASTPSLEHDGETVYFCCEGCKVTFEAQPDHVALAD